MHAKVVCVCICVYICMFYVCMTVRICGFVYAWLECVYLLERLLYAFRVTMPSIMFIHVTRMYMCRTLFCEYCHIHIYVLH